MTNPMEAYFGELASGIEGRLSTQPPEAPKARKTLALEVARLGTRLYSGEETVAWCGVVAPFDLLSAMGVTSCFVEFIGAQVAALGSAEPSLVTAEEAGFAAESCGYHRAICGAAMAGMMPKPDLLIASSTPCIGGLGVVEALARHFERDLFVLHVPQRSDERAVEYLAAQLEEMVAFVTARTGRALDPEALRLTVDRTNRAREAVLEVYRLARARPSPARRRDLFNFGIVFSLLLGTEAGVRVAEVYRDELARRVEAGQGGGAKEERLRLLWLQNRIQFRTELEALLEEEHGAAVVADELNDIAWGPIDPGDVYRGLARRVLSVPLCRSVDYRVEQLLRIARDFQVDGAINPCHWGCRQGTGGRGLVEERLKAAGVPVLNLEVDCIDSRNFSEGQLRTRLQAFLELLEMRRGDR